MAVNIFQNLFLAQSQISLLAERWPMLTNILMVLSVLVLPFLLSRWITRAIRLPSLATRMGFALAALIAGLLFVLTGELRLGPDMQGGTTMIYNILKIEGQEELDPTALASALSQRVDPSGTKELTIRPRGTDQIEITVPTTDQYELQQIKDRITSAGQLEFRVVANTRDHEPIIQLATVQANLTDIDARRKTDVRDLSGKIVGRWYMVGRAREAVGEFKPLQVSVIGDIVRDSQTGQLLNLSSLNSSDEFAVERFLKENGVNGIDVLMAMERNGQPYTEVFGDDLASAQASLGSRGEPNVSFRLAGVGADRMLDLTSSILPDGQFKRRMAIIMDHTVLSAPNLNDAIGTAGVIEGRFTQEEVNFLCNILREGRLPATLDKEVASESRVGAGLGEVTVQKGKSAAWVSIIATVVVMLIYYHFSGAVACFALALNCLLIFAIIIFIRQPLSLPGLAGIVLTIGMAVDANVLIFERIREEKSKGSAARLAIRNGFDRATATIVDANLTTLIAGIVLYWIGTEQVRGFAVTLIIGIVTSLFTAVFCSRIVFEVAEKLKLVSLSMLDGIALTKGRLFGNRDLDFMSSARAWLVGSTLLVVLGLAGAFYRGPGLLNIDFTGGTSVTFQLKEPVQVQTMRDITKEILKDGSGKVVESTLVRVDQDPQDTVYILTTSLESEQLLGELLQEGLAKNNSVNLITYNAKFTKVDSSQSRLDKQGRFLFVSTVAQEGAPDSSQAENQPAAEGDIPTAQPTVKLVKFLVELSRDGGQEPAKRDLKSLRADLKAAAEAAGVSLDVSQAVFQPSPLPVGWRDDQSDAFDKWTVELPLPEEQAGQVVGELVSQIDNTPIWLSLSQIKGRVAGEMQQRAIAAIVVSLFLIALYIWFRFQKLSYGLAAVVATLHDVLVTIGVIALSYWGARYLGLFLIEEFKIGLTEVAALLAIIGYSLNDTIVIFDRIRELRGRSPQLTKEMLNKALNQTLSRTLLTSGTTMLTVLILYIWGGEGIHTFAFALLVGIGVGTYSSIFIAGPVLLWLSSRGTAAAK